MFPALLEGRDPVSVAVVAASGLVLILLYTAHGLSIRTSVAVLGTLFGIALTALISYLVVGVGNFSGISSDDDFLLAGVTQIRLDGLLLAGIIFASVGVLNDVTVTQAGLGIKRVSTKLFTKRIICFWHENWKRSHCFNGLHTAFYLCRGCITNFVTYYFGR
jgi:uncharacterized membrane protein